MKTVMIRADASKTIGFGHFIRSLALAGYLKDDFECRFCTFNPIELSPSRYQLDEISRVARYIPVVADSYEGYNARFLKILTGNEIVVLDNYYFTTEYQQKIKDIGCDLVCVGPVAGRQYVADAVITSGNKPRSVFSLEPSAQYLSGLDHSFLRKPFIEAELRSITNSNPQNVILAVGGADPYGLTNKLAAFILDVKPTISLSVLAGDTVEISQELAARVDVYRKLNAEEIVRLFSRNDVGIFSASTICIEALACRLPVAAGWYVDNQEDFYKYGVKEGLFMPLGNLLDDRELINGCLEKVLNNELTIPHISVDFSKGREDIINLFKNL